MIRNPEKHDAVRVPGHVTVEEAVGISGLLEHTIMEWIDEGLLSAVKPVHKKQLWIKESDLRETITKWKETPRVRHDPTTVSPNEAARILNVTGEAVKQWIYKGLLKATKKRNGYWRIKHDDLKAYLESLQTLSSAVYIATRSETLTSRLTSLAGESGYEAKPVSTMAAALAALKTVPAKALIVDASTFVDAFKLIRRIRGTSDLGSPKILLLCPAPLSEKETNDAVSLGIGGCLVEPVTDAVLRADVKSLLSNTGR